MREVKSYPLTLALSRRERELKSVAPLSKGASEPPGTLGLHDN
jgi:hypothetical protein